MSSARRSPLLIVAAVLLLRWWRGHRLREQMTRELPGATLHSVRFVAREAIIANPMAIRQAASGFLAMGADGIELRGRAPHTGISSRWRFTGNDSIAWIPKSASAIGLPAMLRLRGEEGTVFVHASPALGGSAKASTELFERLSRQLQREELALHEPRWMRGLILIAVALMLGGVAAMIHFALQAKRDFGITQLAVGPDQTLAASSNRELILLTPAGEIAATLPWRALGMPAGIADLMLTDNDELLAGDYAAGVIKRCDLGRRPCDTLPAFADPALRMRRTFKFALAPDGDTLIISDTAAHRLLQVSLTEKSVEISGQAVCFPNTPLVTGDGALIVADTNNHRLLRWPDWQRWLDTRPAAIAVAQNLPTTARRCQAGHSSDPLIDREQVIREHEIAATALPALRRGRIWPSDIAQRPDGKLWVLLGDHGLRFGDVALFTPDGRFVDSIDIDGNTDASRIASIGEELIVVDGQNDELLNFNHRGSPSDEVPLGAIGQRIRGHQADYDAALLGSLWASSVAFAALLACLLLGYLSLRRRIGQVAAEEQ